MLKSDFGKYSCVVKAGNGGGGSNGIAGNSGSGNSANPESKASLRLYEIQRKNYPPKQPKPTPPRHKSRPFFDLFQTSTRSPPSSQTIAAVQPAANLEEQKRRRTGGGGGSSVGKGETNKKGLYYCLPSFSFVFSSLISNKHTHKYSSGRLQPQRAECNADGSDTRLREQLHSVGRRK